MEYLLFEIKFCHFCLLEEQGLVIPIWMIRSHHFKISLIKRFQIINGTYTHGLDGTAGLF